AKGIPATFINSSISTGEQRDRLFSMERGAYKIVYIAPERFRNQAFCDAIANTKVALLAIDEAHCISQWGHDFRPDYLRMAEIREQLDHPPTLALTATATSQVQRDILQQLNLPEAEVFVYGFERPNLFFEIYDARTKGDKIDRMTALLNHYDGEAAIVYCATRKQVEEVARDLTDVGLLVGLYHGGLSDTERERVQNDFMDGVFPVLVATNAFGMGVDKSDIRVIVHYNIPGSIEAYYQEAGRAGRDGNPSHCLMLFNFNDRGIHEFFNEQTYPRRNTIERVWDELAHLGTGTHPLGAEQLTDRVNRGRDRRDKKVNSWGVESSMRQLQRAGHLEFGARDGFPWTTVFALSRTRDLLVDWEYLDRRREVNEGLLQDVVSLTSGRTCRQLYLLRYFNSKPSFEKGCGNCDICCGMPEYARNAMLANTQKTLIPEGRATLVQKVLSGVARARGRCGAHLIAQSLRGSRAKKVKQFGLDRLSTYGVVSYLKQPDIVSLLDQFLRHDLIKRNQHGAISLTELGNTVMHDPEQAPDDLALWLESAFVERRAAPR
ncbi:MAG: RecQ family ATP-dependent DNA helicase, partial [Myxococcota bacterium]